jgi:hypothetical protein
MSCISMMIDVSRLSKIDLSVTMNTRYQVSKFVVPFSF